jgi:hypothetical protein
MASVEDLRQPLINPFTSKISSNIKYTESLPSTTITTRPNSTSAKKKKLLSNEKERGQRLNKQQSFVKDIFMVDMSRRLALRKELHERL